MNRDLKESLIILKSDLMRRRSILIAVIGVLAILVILYGPMMGDENGFYITFILVIVIYIVLLAVLIRSAKYATYEVERRHMSFLISSGIRRRNIFNGRVMEILAAVIIVLIIAPFYPAEDFDALTKIFIGAAMSIGFSVAGMIIYYETFTVTNMASMKLTAFATIVVFLVPFFVCTFIVAISKQYILCSVIIIAVCTAINWYVYKRALRAIEVMDA